MRSTKHNDSQTRSTRRSPSPSSRRGIKASASSRAWRRKAGCTIRRRAECACFTRPRRSPSKRDSTARDRPCRSRGATAAIQTRADSGPTSRFRTFVERDGSKAVGNARMSRESACFWLVSSLLARYFGDSNLWSSRNKSPEQKLIRPLASACIGRRSSLLMRDRCGTRSSSEHEVKSSST